MSKKLKEEETIEQEDLGVVSPQEDDEFVRVEDLEKFDRKPLDLSQYIGNEVMVVSVELRKGSYGKFLKVTTAPVVKEPIELRASKIYGVTEEGEKFGWVKEGKLDLDLKKYKVGHPKDLVGVKVKIQTRANKEGTEFLTF